MAFYKVSPGFFYIRNEKHYLISVPGIGSWSNEVDVGAVIFDTDKFMIGWMGSMFRLRFKWRSKTRGFEFDIADFLFGAAIDHFTPIGAPETINTPDGVYVLQRETVFTKRPRLWIRTPMPPGYRFLSVPGIHQEIIKSCNFIHSDYAINAVNNLTQIQRITTEMRAGLTGLFAPPVEVTNEASL